MSKEIKRPDYIFTFSMYDEREEEVYVELESDLRTAFGKNILILYIGDEENFTMSQLNNTYTRLI